MTDDRQRYLVAYDIEDDRLRTRVASKLEGVGLRVQKSVFECLLAPPALDKLAGDLGRLMAGSEGADIRVYRLCTSCFAASFGLGELEEGTGAEPWIIA